MNIPEIKLKVNREKQEIEEPSEYVIIIHGPKKNIKFSDGNCNIICDSKLPQIFGEQAKNTEGEFVYDSDGIPSLKLQYNDNGTIRIKNVEESGFVDNLQKIINVISCWNSTEKGLLEYEMESVEKSYGEKNFDPLVNISQKDLDTVLFQTQIYKPTYLTLHEKPKTQKTNSTYTLIVDFPDCYYQLIKKKDFVCENGYVLKSPMFGKLKDTKIDEKRVKILTGVNNFQLPSSKRSRKEILENLKSALQDLKKHYVKNLNKMDMTDAIRI